MSNAKGLGIAPAPAGWKLSHCDAKGAAWYVPVDGEGNPTVQALDPSKSKANAEDEAKKRAHKLERAEDLWQRACGGRGELRGVDHPVIRSYLAGRGIDLTRLPAGKVSGWLRYFDQADDRWYKSPDASATDRAQLLKAPAMVALVADTDFVADGTSRPRFAGVQTTYFDPATIIADGGGVCAGVKKRPSAPDLPNKRFHGSCDGTVRLYEPGTNGLHPSVLCIGEGIETCIAVTAATGYATWAGLVVDNLGRLRLPPAIFRPFGDIHTVVLLGEIDVKKRVNGRLTSPASQTKMPLILNALRAQLKGRSVQIVSRFPCSAHCGGLVRRIDGEDWPADGPEAAKGIDYDDVNRELGAAAVAASINEGLDLTGAANDEPGDAPHGGPAEGRQSDAGDDGASGAGAGGGGAGGGKGGGGKGGGDDDDDSDDNDDDGPDEDGTVRCKGENYRRRLMRNEDLFLARAFLEEHYAGAPIKKGETRARRANTTLELVYIREGKTGQFHRFNAAHWYEMAEDAIDRDVRRWLTPCAKATYVKGKLRYVPFNPADNKVSAIRKAIADEVFVDAGGVPLTQRFWMRPLFDSGGHAVWARNSWDVVARSGKAINRPEPEDVLTFTNCQISRSALVAGKLQHWKPTPLLYNQTIFEYELPIADVQLALDTGDWSELHEKCCPTWLKFIQLLNWTPEEVELLQVWVGYVQAFDQSHKEANVLFLAGPGDAGKGTTEEAIQLAVGSRNVVKTSPKDLPDTFHLASFRHKVLAIISESETGTFADAAEAMRLLKTITGGDTVNVRDLFEKARPNERLWTRFLISCNEMPDLQDRSGTWLNRVRMLEFRKSNTGKIDRSLKQGIMNEGLGLVLWGLEGAVKLARIAHIPQPLASTSPLDCYRAYTAPLEAFCLDGAWLEYVPKVQGTTYWPADSFVTDVEMHQLYCAVAGLDLDVKRRAKMMKSLHSPLRKAGWGGRYQIDQVCDDGSKANGWWGMRLTMAARTKLASVSIDAV